jgi:hypothetical protein
MTNYFGFDTDKATEKLGAEIYLGDMEINDRVAAMFHSPNYDVSKGHKEFPYLTMVGDTIYVGALDKDEFELVRYLTVAKCTECGETIRSLYRHDMVSCKCGAISIDGGIDYTKISGDIESADIRTMDMLTGEVMNSE